MAKYTTEVEAFQMTEVRYTDKSKWPAWLKKVWTDDAPAMNTMWLEDSTGELFIGTMGGAFLVPLDSWIIQDVLGVLSVRAPNVFEEIFTAVKK